MGKPSLCREVKGQCSQIYGPTSPRNWGIYQRVSDMSLGNSLRGPELLCCRHLKSVGNLPSITSLSSCEMNIFISILHAIKLGMCKIFLTRPIRFEVSMST